MKIGIPSERACVDMAKDLYLIGVRSCADADAAGCWLTDDAATRERIDFWLDLFERHAHCCQHPPSAGV